MKSYNEDRNIGYFLEVHVQYHEDLHKLHNDFLFASKNKHWKFEKFAATLHNKKECYTHKKLKQAINHGLILKKSVESLNSIKKLS